ETVPEAHAVLGLISMYNYEWTNAEQELRRAIELKADYPTAHHRYAILLIATGRVKEALAEAERGRQLDPTSLAINNFVAAALYANGELNRAIEQAKKTLELDPGFALGRHQLALEYMAQGSYAEAVAELEKVKASLPVLPSRYAGSLGCAYAMSGQRAE